MSKDRTYDFMYAAEATKILHAPTKALETFGTTCVNYHLLAELEDYPGKIRIREGRLQACKPELITPEQYVKDEFEGFGEMARQYYDFLKSFEDSLKILKYGYRLKQEAFSEQIVTDSMEAVAERDHAQVLPSGATAANALGLSEQVPMKYTFITSGSSRVLTVDGREIKLKRAVPRNFAYKTRLAALIVQALKSIGEEGIGEEETEALRRVIGKNEEKEAFRADVQMMPIWMKKVLNQLPVDVGAQRSEGH